MIATMDNTIQTMHGKRFTYSDENPEEVSLFDISLALSRVPRFMAYTDEFYSVAQHSVLVSRVVQQMGGNANEQMLGLLHDATEAYMSDLPKPLKNLLPDYQAMERLIWAKISTHFLGEVVELPEIVKEADYAMYLAEVRDLRDVDTCTTERRDYGRVPATTIVPYSMDLSQKLFLDTYGILNECIRKQK